MADAMREPRIGHPRPPEIKRLPQLLTLVGSEALTSKTHLVSPLCNPINVFWAIRCLPLARLLCLAPAFLGLLSFACYTFALGGANPLVISQTLGIAELLRPLGRRASLTLAGSLLTFGGSFGIASALDIATLLCALLANCTIPLQPREDALEALLAASFQRREGLPALGQGDRNGDVQGPHEEHSFGAAAQRQNRGRDYAYWVSHYLAVRPLAAHERLGPAPKRRHPRKEQGYRLRERE